MKMRKICEYFGFRITRAEKYCYSLKTTAPILMKQTET